MAFNQSEYNRKRGVDPCECGSDNLVLWLEQDQSFDNWLDAMTSLQKIECMECGNVIFDGCAEAIEEWNNHEYE